MKRTSRSKKRDYVVVSVGGSLIVPDAIDTSFLQSLRTLVQKKIKDGLSFYIITGGGKVCRRYQDVARSIIPNTTPDTLDWIGIASTRLNAELVRSVFPEYKVPEVVHDTRKKPRVNSPVILAGGVAPGNSSDWAAVKAARAMGAKRLVNLSNIDYVYTADPRKDPTATKIEKISWKEFRKLLPKKWDPGLSSPFDPIAAKEAQALGLEVVVINGARLREFENYLSGKPFIGTIIS